MKIYVVQKGDTLYEIAQKHGISLADLKKMNPQLKNPDMIMPGMKIKVPVAGGPAKKKEQQVKKEAQIKKGKKENIAPNNKMPVKEKKKEMPIKEEQKKPLPKKTAPITKKEVPVKKAPVKKQMPMMEMEEKEVPKYKHSKKTAPTFPMMDENISENLAGMENKKQNLPLMDNNFPNVMMPKPDHQMPINQKANKQDSLNTMPMWDWPNAGNVNEHHEHLENAEQNKMPSPKWHEVPIQSSNEWPNHEQHMMPEATMPAEQMPMAPPPYYGYSPCGCDSGGKAMMPYGYTALEGIQGSYPSTDYMPPQTYQPMPAYDQPYQEYMHQEYHQPQDDWQDYQGLSEFQQPEYQQPSFQQPVYQQQPVYPQQPVYQQPVYQQPGYQQPGYQQPGYQQPGYQQQGYNAADFMQPGFQPMYQPDQQLVPQSQTPYPAYPQQDMWRASANQRWDSYANYEEPPYQPGFPIKNNEEE
ncbi:morphogenetic protein associated with SpoVID [Scopulibacillus darangshiensis]|uniref:Morphogenetic protein associated with SpoVID n=1 Tax=Scopulibacillus darangshiensis TaxID=442528 RepID=A0A4R2PB61_9BACL|nr:SafA/ExsA family spore coat assembly protein [Scopulibacillus darangshiensis]TCP32252.1 morphogenetic protein associated with SpoVID [Scopulibacillus darangshiensis]